MNGVIYERFEILHLLTQRVSVGNQVPLENLAACSRWIVQRQHLRRSGRDVVMYREMVSSSPHDDDRNIPEVARIAHFADLIQDLLLICTGFQNDHPVFVKS